MFGKNKKFTINILLICLATIVIMLSLVLILLPYLKRINMKTDIISKVGLTTKYKANEEQTDTNSWDISLNADGSVIATLDEEGTLTISGTGEMKNWSGLEGTDWHNLDINGKVRKVIIEEGVTNIGKSAFCTCAGLINIKIPKSVQIIDGGAFSGCKNLYKIEIPENVSVISSHAFNDELAYIKVNKKNKVFCDIDGVLYSKDMTELKKYPPRKEGQEYIIPNTVTEISSGAFKYCYNLIDVTIPEGVLTIDSLAFWECENLTNINIPSTVDTLENGVFEGCVKLINIDIAEGITIIKSSAFEDCTSLESIKIPSSVTEIKGGISDGCAKLTEIKVDSGNTKYYDNNGIVYTKDNTEIVSYPEGKQEKQYTILSGVKKIGKEAFSHCANLINIEIPESVTKIDNEAFEGCTNLMIIKIPESVKSIGGRAFSNCTNLTSIEIPNNVIGTCDKYVFSGAEISNIINEGSNTVELLDIFKRAQNEEDILFSNEGFEFYNCTIENNNVKIDEGKTFATIEIKSGILEGLQYFVFYNKWDLSINRDGSVIAILSLDGTLDITGSGEISRRIIESECADKVKCININNGITEIKNLGYKNLCSVKIPNSVTIIYNLAFSFCKELTTITIPNTVTSIGSGAFNKCAKLDKIVIPESVTTIGENPFEGCLSLKEIKVNSNNPNYCDENGVLYTKDKSEIIAYPNGKGTEYTILNGVTKIADSAFYECKNLKSIVIPEGVTQIGALAFGLCSNLRSIDIPNTVTIIENSAFSYCEILKNIEIPESVINIEDFAFIGCYKLRDLIIKSEYTKIDTGIVIGADAVTIVCYKDSSAEEYAIENNIRYRIIGTSNIITSTVLKVDEENQIIKGINPEMTPDEISEIIQSEILYEIQDESGNTISEYLEVGTGYIIKMEDGKTYTLIVSGDCNGDGKVTVREDMMLVNAHRLSGSTLTNAYLIAADADENGQIKINDMILINAIRLKQNT